MPYTNPNELQFLNDVEVQDPEFPLEAGNILIYDDTAEKWVNGPISDLGIPDIDYAGGSYTPVWASANEDLEYDGGVTGHEILYGNPGQNGIVYFSIEVSMTDVTDFGTGNYSITIPVESLVNVVIPGQVTDDSNGHVYSAALRLSAGNNVAEILYIGTNARYEALDNNSPVALAEEDSMTFSGWYRAELPE
jgi:hypothetical protein